MNLNFGHTFAHAIEMAIENNIKKDYIRHGEAVGIGILSEIYYANKKRTSLYNKVKSHLLEFNLPINLNCSEIPINKVKLQNDIYKNLFLDKKRIDKHPRYISLKTIGKPFIQEMVDYDFINDTILEVIINRDDKKDLKFFDPQIEVKQKAVGERLQFIPKTQIPIPSEVEISESGMCNRKCHFCPK